MTNATQTETTTQTETANSTNQFILTGYLGDNPIVKHFDSGNSLTEISVAVNEPGKEKASWYRVVLWNKVGQIAAQYLQKGSKVTVKGQFKFDTWTDKNTGETRRTLKLHVNDSFALDLHRTKNESASQETNHQPVPAPKPVSVEVISDEEWENIAFG